MINTILFLIGDSSNKLITISDWIDGAIWEAIIKKIQIYAEKIILF